MFYDDFVFQKSVFQWKAKAKMNDAKASDLHSA